MRGKRAKQIKKLIYGDDYSPRNRHYQMVNKKEKIYLLPLFIVSDNRRRGYKLLKRGFKFANNKAGFLKLIKMFKRRPAEAQKLAWSLLT
jgi:regulatory protein YycH of two-component signal transduction system YycFG